MGRWAEHPCLPLVAWRVGDRDEWEKKFLETADDWLTDDNLSSELDSPTEPTPNYHLPTSMTTALGFLHI